MIADVKTLMTDKRVPMVERITIWLAWHMPKRIAYWCTIRVASNATTGKYSDQVVPDLKVMEALARWGRH
jgi:hypothetical protein